MEYEQAREEIAKWLHDHTVKIRQESIPWLGKTAWEDLPKDTRLDTQKAWRDKADQILSLDGIEIRADGDTAEDGDGSTLLSTYRRLELFWFEPETQQILSDMVDGLIEVSELTERLMEVLKDELHFRRVIPKPKRK